MAATQLARARIQSVNRARRSSSFVTIDCARRTTSSSWHTVRTAVAKWRMSRVRVVVTSSHGSLRTLDTAVGCEGWEGVGVPNVPA